MKLGKLPAREGATKFKLAQFFDASKLPAAPPHFRYKRPPAWHDYGNTLYGCCVWAGAANETALWEKEGRRARAAYSEDTVLRDYGAVTGFDPNNPETDQGTDMEKAAAYRRKTGILDTRGKRHRIDAYAALRLGSMQVLRSALYAFGGLGVGFMFPTYAWDQFSNGGPWDYKLFGPTRFDGGHYVAAIGIAENGNIICVSWGKEIEMTPRFYTEFADEVTAYIDFARVRKAEKPGPNGERPRLSPEGFDTGALREALAGVTLPTGFHG